VFYIEMIEAKGDMGMKNQRIYVYRVGMVSLIFALFMVLFIQVPTASAVPSYARQTGFPCKSCHYMPPELTPLGRAFKLNGYTMSGKPTITSPGKGNVSSLNILESCLLRKLKTPIL
jgi:hypothetical protein